MQHKIARPVNIIGTSTLGQKYFDDPAYAGLSVYELFAYACHQAMEDAGVKPKDIDKLVYSHFAYFPTCGNIMAPVGIMEEWIGMREKPIMHVEQACASGYISFMEACNSVASGKYDIVMVCGVENPKHFVPRDQPAYKLKPLAEYDQWWHPGRVLFDCTYYRFDGVSDNLLTEEQGKYYIKNYGIDEKTLDDTYNAMAISLRRGAARNERALSRVEFADLAKEAGYDDVMEYMRSNHNPKITQYIRKSGSLLHNVAAGAIIVASEDATKQLGIKKPIKVVDYASASNTERNVWCFHQMNVAVRDQLLGDGVNPADVDLLVTTVTRNTRSASSIHRNLKRGYDVLQQPEGCQTAVDQQTDAAVLRGLPFGVGAKQDRAANAVLSEYWTQRIPQLRHRIDFAHKRNRLYTDSIAYGEQNGKRLPEPHNRSKFAPHESKGSYPRLSAALRPFSAPCISIS